MDDLEQRCLAALRARHNRMEPCDDESLVRAIIPMVLEHAAKVAEQPTWTGELWVQVKGRKHVVVGIMDAGWQGQYRTSFEVHADEVNPLMLRDWLGIAILRCGLTFRDAMRP